MKAAFVDYQHRLVDIQEKMNSSNDHLDARWLKQNIMTQALPNGLCSLPLTQQKCPHANACLTCIHLGHLKSTLNSINHSSMKQIRLLKMQKQNGWHRTVEMNTEVVGNLTLIINSLEKADD